MGRDDGNELCFCEAKGESRATDSQFDGSAEGGATQHGAFGAGDESHIDEASSKFALGMEGIDDEGQAVLHLVKSHEGTIRGFDGMVKVFSWM
jgi:hypothetical protein